MGDFVVDGITLPMIPGSFTRQNGVARASEPYPGRMPFVLIKGLKEPNMIVQGYIAKQGKTLLQLRDEYCIPLEIRQGAQVVVTDPNNLWNDLYIIDDFYYDVTNKYPTAYKFKLTLIRASYALVLQGFNCGPRYAAAGATVKVHVRGMTPTKTISATIKTYPSGTPSVLSLTGTKTVDTYGNCSVTFTVPSLASGIYIITISDNNTEPKVASNTFIIA